MLPVYMLLSTHPPIGPLCTGIVAMLLSAFSYVDTVHVCGEELIVEPCTFSSCGSSGVDHLLHPSYYSSNLKAPMHAYSPYW